MDVVDHTNKILRCRVAEHNHIIIIFTGPDGVRRSGRAKKKKRLAG